MSTGAEVGPAAGPVLAGLRALVARPQRAEDVFSNRLRALGCRVHSLPVMTIAPLAVETCRQRLAGLAAFDKVVVVSVNAARLAAEYLDAVALKGGPAWFAVGQGSAAPLLAMGVPVTCPEREATSEGLLALPAFAQVAAEKVLIIRGEGGRDKLRAELTARGASVDFCELYRRELDTGHSAEIRRLASAGEIDLVVAHSVDVLGNLLSLLAGSGVSLGGLAVLVPSDKAAELARRAGFGTVVAAASALPDAMVEAARGWYTSDRK